MPVGGEIPPRFSSPLDKGGEEKFNLRKLREKTAYMEYVRPYQYTSEFRRDVSGIPSSNRGSQIQRWPSKPGKLFGEARRVKRME